MIDSTIFQLKRLIGVDDLFFFSKYILGYDLIEHQPHEEVCRFIQTWKKNKKMLLLPRGSLKTTVGTIAHCVQKTLQNPNIRILIASETYGQAIKFLSEIKGHFESERFRGYYGNMVGKLWRESEIIISTRTANKKEPTISTAGIDVTKTGMHYDLIIVDDPHSQKNVTTRDQIDQVIDWYRLLLSMLEPDGKIMLIGTRWDFDDLYGVIEKELSDDYDIMIRSAEENGKLFFPTRLTRKFLDEQKREQGIYIYSMQYELNPIPSEHQTFRPEWIKYYDVDIPDNLSVFIACDPALTEDQHVAGDDTAIVVVGVAEDNEWYILEIRSGHFSPDQINSHMFELHRTWGALKIGIESESFGKLLKPSLEKYFWDRKIYPYIEELKSGGTKKELRIKSLQPLFQQGKVFMQKPDFINRDEFAKLYDQLIHFPKSKFDDVIDALAYVNSLAHYKPFKPKLTQIEQKILNLKKQHRQKSFSGAYSPR